MVFADPGEEPTQALRRYVADDALGIASLARHLEGGLGNVAGEDLKVGNALDCGELLDQHHRERIGLLAGGASAAPHADRLIPVRATDEVGDDLLGEHRKGFRLPEECRHPDQQVLVERRDLFGVLPQPLEIIVCPIEVQQPHAPLHAAHQHALAVAPEVVPGPRSKQGQNPLDRLGCLLPGRDALCPGLQVGVVDVAQERGGHVLGSEHVVDQAGGDRAARHLVVFGRGRILHHDHTADELDLLDAGSTVAAGA